MPTTVPGFKGTIHNVMSLLNAAASGWSVVRGPGS